MWNGNFMSGHWSGVAIKPIRLHKISFNRKLQVWEPFHFTNVLYRPGSSLAQVHYSSHLKDSEGECSAYMWHSDACPTPSISIPEIFATVQIIPACTKLGYVAWTSRLVIEQILKLRSTPVID